MDEDFLDFFKDEEISMSITKAAYELAHNAQFARFMKWWTQEQKSYADNLLTGELNNKEEHFRKSVYLQGQKADTNMILHTINELAKQYDREK